MNDARNEPQLTTRPQTAPVIDDGAVEYTEYTFPYFDIDAGQELWNGLPSRDQDVRWFELYSGFSFPFPLLPLSHYYLSETRLIAQTACP